jgi:hypothetical protein
MKDPPILKDPRFDNRNGKASAVGPLIAKISAIVGATLILPLLAYSGKNQGDKNQQGIHAVPDGDPGIALLVTTIGAILVLSARLSSRKEA